jgi:hypothetical protein
MYDLLDLELDGFLQAVEGGLGRRVESGVLDGDSSVMGGT